MADQSRIVSTSRRETSRFHRELHKRLRDELLNNPLFTLLTQVHVTLRCQSGDHACKNVSIIDLGAGNLSVGWANCRLYPYKFRTSRVEIDNRCRRHEGLAGLDAGLRWALAFSG
ncbi:protein of unknown function [Bradyrhizobium sp. ORS 285]|nr:protein of unknown function [Bradyrhizobium sp. ORS 285]